MKLDIIWLRSLRQKADHIGYAICPLFWNSSSAHRDLCEVHETTDTCTVTVKDGDIHI